MKLGLVIYSTDSETVWNAFRLGVFALQKGDRVSVFLLASGVEAETLDTTQFKVTEQMQAFVDKGGDILACGTCLKIRQQGSSELCPISTMQDLYTLVQTCDKTLTF
jgi:uncharacterized protein involved in oxidation of intracellular sulfur